MNSLYHRYYFPDEEQRPGSGAGLAGDPLPGEEERKAVQKKAGNPGNAENAAGTSGEAAGGSNIGSKPVDDSRIDRGDRQSPVDPEEG